ncbi:alpha/beta fold hydrolase, partial [Armatimonas sp.]|uniref:alpha/beta fold hydrolase n=1 Tax=Armatimonas sp. TaxID=1872638 RepID=UPI003752E729
DPAAGRYETGQRLRQFEILWETASAEKKRQVLPLINQAVMGFFAGGPSASAKPLDQAILLLGEEKDRTPERRWAMPLIFTTSVRLADTDVGVEFRVSRLYETPEKAPESLLVGVGGEGPPLNGDLGEVPVTGFPMTAFTYFAAAPREVDGSVRMSVKGQSLVTERLISLSYATNLKARLTALEGVREPSVVHLLGILKKLAGGEALETDFPGLKLLREAEAAAKNAALWGKKQAGQFWLTLNKAPVRLLAPDAVKSGKPLPLVIALHGAGGSENMFFDTYGAGKLVRLCEKRGWLLLTLRNGAGLGELPALLAELGKLYSYDPKRVFLTGHSMGAAMAVQAAQANPKTFAAVAVLGGGGVVRSAEGLPPFLVGAGASDFGKSGAQGLAKALKTECKIYPDCEHLTVVQDALADVMRFFEKAWKAIE